MVLAEIKQGKTETFVEDERANEEKRFQEQCFLIEFYKTFAEKNKQVVYENFSKLRSTSSAALLLNRLLGIGVSEFMNITTHQLSLLQPKIKIFKRQISPDTGKEVDVELRFDDKSNKKRFEDITANRSQLGGGVVLKSFEWEDLGTNPGDTGKAFKATLQMHFQNAEDLFLSRQRAGQPDTSFADLIRIPPKQFFINNTYNDASFRIIVVVGWNVPSKTSINFNPILLKSIENTTTTFFLTLTSHELEYSEDGNINLTAEYMAAIEGKLLSAETDVL